MKNCDVYGGSGKVNYSNCDGVGIVRNSSYFPILSEVSTFANDWVECPSCHGSGEKSCRNCGGSV